ncbi:TRPM8 channel-associated factor homolog [Pholidichthys leucotaenia]
MSKQQPHTYPEEAYKTLTRGLKELDLRGSSVPCELVLIGDQAFPFAMNSKGQVLMAASLYGRGRIVVLGHEVYLETLPALVENALTWLRGDGSENLKVGVNKNVSVVAENLKQSRVKAAVVEAFSDKLEVGVYVTDAYTLGTDPKELVAYLKAGGGVLIAGQAWHWSYSHRNENTLLEFEGNKVSGVAGIYFTETYGEIENLPVYPLIPTSWMTVVSHIKRNFKDDLQFLVKEISEVEIPSGSLASEVLVHSPLAFPIATNKNGEVFLAGAYYGQGRVVVVSHEGLLQLEDQASLWHNAIHWLDKGRKGVIGITPDLSLSFDILSKSEYDCKKTDFRKDLSVFVCTVYKGDAKEIQDFVAEGGGLLIGGHAWYWAQNNSSQNPMTEFSGNKILNNMGLSLLENTIGETSYQVPAPSQTVKDAYHFYHLLHHFIDYETKGKKLEKHDEKYLPKLARHCASYISMNAVGCHSYIQVVSTLTDILKKFGMPQVSYSSPAKSPKDLLLLSVGAEVYKVCPNPDALLPYLIKDNPVLPVVYNQKIKLHVDTADMSEWISTGFYLSPGMKTYISIPVEIINKGWEIQIGCQTDHVKAEELRRAPKVYERFHVTTEIMKVWNLWGGLIYLVAPPKTQVKGIEAVVQMAVTAPYYKSGVTTTAEWSLLRKAPSPWAELEFDNIILTVQSDFVRDLEGPDELAVLWNDIMKSIADLAVIPHTFPRKERFVTDVQISAGWMHAGYPIMAHKPSAGDVVSVDFMKTKGIWGPIHELGHNQQRSCWEFSPNTTECTCNLWSVYVHETVLGIDRAKAHESMTPTERLARINEYVKGGRDLSSWEIFLALETYMQLQERFGWDAFKKVFAVYHNMTDFPTDNTGKMNLYAVTFSKIVKMNLAGFFKAWGWPIDKATEEKLLSLPSWNDHPLVKYD